MPERDEMVFRVVTPSRFGDFVIEGDRWAVTRVVLPGRLREDGAASSRPDRVPACLHDAHGQLSDYLQGRRESFDLPVRREGTPFQEQVWDQLEAIGFGETVTYSELGTAIGRPAGARAVGQALGANPLPVLLPCHRVVASGGPLGGYAGGPELKAALLELESGAAGGGRRLGEDG